MEPECLTCIYTCQMSSIWITNDREMKVQFCPTCLQAHQGAVRVSCSKRGGEPGAECSSKTMISPTSSQDAELQVQVRIRARDSGQDWTQSSDYPESPQ